MDDAFLNALAKIDLVAEAESVGRELHDISLMCVSSSRGHKQDLFVFRRIRRRLLRSNYQRVWESIPATAAGREGPNLS